MIERMTCAARRRHFSADHIKQVRGALGPRGRLGDHCKTRSARRGRLIVQRFRLASAAHRGIEVNLRKTGFDKSRDHRIRLCKGCFRRQLSPWIGAEMVAAKYEPVSVETDFPRDRLDMVDEGARGHAGIPAFMIDLVARRLDQDMFVGFYSVAKRSLDDDGMRRTNGSDADLFSHAPSRRKHRDRVLHSGDRRWAMKASSSAKLDAPSIGPLIVTARAPAALA